jgi:outer membrane protein assembly factor BamB
VKRLNNTGMVHAWVLFSASYGLFALGAHLSAQTVVNVTQHHNHASRDGLYIEPAFTPSAAANLKRDLSFNGTISGNVYAQPLYVEGGLGGRALVLAVTESNNVYALDAADGQVVWQRHVGEPVPQANLPCGDINPLGITGTPIIDLPTRTLFFDAMTTPDHGTTKKHLLFALNVDTGTTNSGWPVDVGATARTSSTVFTSVTQNERGALALAAGNLYVPYGGHAGDCDTYYGWLLSVPLNNPGSVTAWATLARGGGAWAVGGPASDGASVYLTTGNTFGASNWSGGEALLRFAAGPLTTPLDYWAPANWLSLDNSDLDIGGSGPLLVDVPGATPSQLALALGKDGNAYLLDRGNLRAVGAPVAQAQVSGNVIIQAAATYHTAQGTYFVFCDIFGSLSAVRIAANNPPTMTTAWSASEHGRGSPFVTSTDGTNNVIVWGIGSEGDQRLHAFNADTGAIIYAGGGTNELMAGTHRFNTGIAARGRIYVANDNKVYAFSVPVYPVVISNVTALPGHTFRFSFTNAPGVGFTAFAATNVSMPFTNWARLGNVPEVSPGLFQFTDSELIKGPARFYRVRSP